MKSNPILELLILIAIDPAVSLKITDLKVPLSGHHEVPFDCHYDLENHQLYDVKWYKDGEQFFRCLPNGDTQQYPVEGIRIYVERTPRPGSCPLTLVGLSDKSAGVYKCEVTGEGPAFLSAAKSTRFSVVEPARRTQSDLKENQQDQTEGMGTSLEKPNRRVIALLVGHYLFWYLYIY